MHLPESGLSSFVDVRWIKITSKAATASRTCVVPTLEVCVAILESAAQRRELTLNYQSPANAVGSW